MIKNINWNGGARKRLKTLYQENGSFGVFCGGERELLPKKVYETKGFFTKGFFVLKSHVFFSAIDNEEELFLRLFLKEERLKKEENLKENARNVQNLTEYEKKIEVIPGTFERNSEKAINGKRPFISEFYRRKI